MGSRAALLSVPLLLATVFVAPSAIAAAPAPVSSLGLSTQDGYVYIDWTASTATPSAVVCYAVNTTPTSPVASDTTTCSDVLTQSAWSFYGVDGTSYGVSVFSYDTTTKEYGTPVSGTITAVDPAPLAPSTLHSVDGYSASEVTLFWADNSANHDTKDYLVSWAPGLSTPGPPSETVYPHVVTWTSVNVPGLSGGSVYTFAVRVRDVAGHVGPPAVVQAATRQGGLWLKDNNTVGHLVESAWAAEYGITPGAGSALVQSDGVVRAITANDSGSIAVRTYAAGKNWYQPGAAYWYYNGSRLPLIAAAPRIIVAAWSSANGVYYATKTSTNWAKPVRISSNASETVVGLASDRAHRVHLLVVRTAGLNRGLYYLTRYAGRTYRSFVAGSGPADIGLLTRDPTTDKIVVVDRHRSAKVETIRTKVLSPWATSVGTLATWLSTTTSVVQWRPTSVAANGGRITVGIARVTTSGSTSGDGPFAMYGTATLHRSAVRVAGTSSVDTNLVVTAPTPTKVLLSWKRHNAGWSPAKLGIWVSTRTFKTSLGYWTFGSQAHWTTSAYDTPLGAFNDAAGHTYVVYVTQPGDVTP